MSSLAPLPAALQSRNPIRWLSVFGPGAIIASLTIGVGELVFSTRGGAIFGYRLLWFFVVVLAMKWVLVFVSARHMVLTGAHPFQRWMELPGPRGWLPLVFFLLAVPCFPVWVSFHAGTLGTLLSALTGTEHILNQGGAYVWGLAMLTLVLGLCAMGGYSALEKIQITIVVLMLGCVVLAVFFINPDWSAFMGGLFLPQPLHYPSWIQTYPAIASRPVWVEISTYVGIIGGSSYDYLAYVSYLRDKQWGRAGAGIIPRAELEAQTADAKVLAEGRRWLRVPLIDCILSFAAVLVFTAVFVICGAEVLGPQHKVPSGSNLLTLQAEFVTAIHPWFRHVYFAGAFLAVFGTLYGTIEVAPTIFREMALAVDPQRASAWQNRLRLWSVGWVGVVGWLLLAWLLLRQVWRGPGEPPDLIKFLTPANLFTGVLGCGLVCLGNLWMDRRFLPRALGTPFLLVVLSLVSALVFLGLGFKAYWDYSQSIAFVILAATLAVGLMGAWMLRRFGSPARADREQFHDGVRSLKEETPGAKPQMDTDGRRF